MKSVDVKKITTLKLKSTNAKTQLCKKTCFTNLADSTTETGCPSVPATLMADRKLSKNEVGRDESIVTGRRSATWRARRVSWVRWLPTAPTTTMFPLVSYKQVIDLYQKNNVNLAGKRTRDDKTVCDAFWSHELKCRHWRWCCSTYRDYAAGLRCNDCSEP